jgi:hypothetical protein
MARATHAELRAKSTVSIWLGGIQTEAEFDKYLRCCFADDFGFEIDPPAGPESSARAGAPIAIRPLLSGFSFASSFIDHAVRVASEHGWTVANAAVVFYGLRYDPSLIANARAPLQFLVVVPQSPQ